MASMAGGSRRTRVGVDADDVPRPAGSLEELYRRELRSLVRFGFLLTGDQEAAEDLVHDAFVGLQPRWGSLTDPQRALGYVKVSMLNGSRTRHRRVLLERRARREGLVDEDAAPTAEDAVLLADRERAVVAQVAGLPTRQRQVLALRYWGGMSEAEIAAALGISVGTVKSSASRGLSALAERMQEDPR